MRIEGSTLSAEIDRFIDELRLEWDPENREAFRVEPSDIVAWTYRTGLDEVILLNKMGMALAKGFHEGRLEFWFCNDLVNDVWHYLLAADHLRDTQPAIFCEVFYAFESGEITTETVHDPIEFYARPLIAKLLGTTN